MGCSSFAFESYLDPDAINAATYSSQRTSYEADNAYDFVRRTKVWRSAGYWKITSSNNVIKFEEQLSTPLTATVIAGEYASDALFFAAVKAALELAGANTYTITRDATSQKIKINAQGGTGYLTLLWTNVSSAGFAAMAGFSTATNQSGGLTYYADIIKLHTVEFLEWDLGLSSSPQALYLIGDRNKPIPLSPEATITLKGSHTNSFTSAEYSQVLIYNEKSIFQFDIDGLSAADPLRYWRLEIVDPSNMNGWVEIGKAFLGTVIKPSRGAVQFPLAERLLENTKVFKTESGQTLANKQPQTESFSLRWFGLTSDERSQLRDHFAHYGNSRPFFMDLDPDGNVEADRNDLIKFVRYVGEPDTALVAPGVFEFNCELAEEL